MKIKTISGWVLVLALTFGGLAFAGPASAIGNDAPPCVATDAIPAVTAVAGVAGVAGQPFIADTSVTTVVTPAGWQNYSYTGSSVVAPPFPGALGDWNSGPASDPHDVGVAGEYLNGSHWFYLEATPEVTETTGDPGQPEIAAVTAVEGSDAVPAVVCYDRLAYTGVDASPWVILAAVLSLLAGAGLMLLRRTQKV